MFNLDTLTSFAKSLRYVTQYPYWGEDGFYYHRPGSVRKRGFPFFTVKKEGETLFLHFHLPEKEYETLFGKLPNTFVELPEDTLPSHGPLTPHPIFGWMGWVRAKNPSDDDMLTLKEIMIKAHAYAESNDAGEG